MNIDYFRLFIGHSDSTDISIATRGRHADVLFVDVDVVSEQSAATIASALRTLADEIEMHEATVVRMPEGGIGLPSGGEELRSEICRRLRLQPDHAIAVLEHRGRLSPVVHNHSALVDFVEGGSLIAELRAAELGALIAKRSALITSSSLRFILPSSVSSASFLLLSSAIRDARDVDILAGWVLAELPRECNSFVVGLDTPGLLAVAERLRSRLAHEGASVHQVMVTAGYPFGTGDSDGVLPHVGPADCFVYLLSVSRSGKLENLVATALERVGGGRADRLLCTFASLAADRGTGGETGRVRRVCFARVVPPQEPSAADLAGRPPVRVTPSTFQLVPELGVAPSPVPHPPLALEDAFFAVAASSGAVGVECRPHGLVSSVRPRTRLLSFRVLLEELSAGAAAAIDEDSELSRQIADRLSVQGIGRRYGALVLPEADAMEGGAGVTRARSLLSAAGVEVGVASSTEDWHAESPPGSVLLFLWGSVTGASVVRSVRELRGRSEDMSIDVVVAHLRAPSSGEEEVLRRAIGSGRLATIWNHVVPWTSLFSREAANIARWRESEAGSSSRWSDRIASRLEVIAPAGANRRWRHRVGLADGGLSQRARNLFWVPPIELEAPGRGAWVRGWMADEPTLLLAGSAALQEARSSAEHGVGLRVDLPGAVDHDLPRRWLAAIVRCAEQGELWFGTSTDEQLHRTEFLCDWLSDSTGAVVLVGELLAADALGKVPSAASSVIAEFAESLDDEWIRLLLAYVEWSRGKPKWERR